MSSREHRKRLRDPLRGSLVALPTPFQDGQLDLDAFRHLIDLQVGTGTTGLVIAGTTGEAATLSKAERLRLFEVATEHAPLDMAIVAGTGTHCTRTTIELSSAAEFIGVDALLVVTPYYNRPDQRGLFLHYDAVARAVSLDIALYNVPARTAVDLLPSTVADLARAHTNVAAVKEALPSVERAAQHLSEGAVSLLCGEDLRLAEFAALGAAGAISVIGNLLPREVSNLLEQAAPSGDNKRAMESSERLAPLSRALFLGPNPVPLKQALAILGHCSAEVRLPLAPLEAHFTEQLRCELAALGLGAPASAAPVG